MSIKNAQITSTMLGIEDHGIMTFMVIVKWDGGIIGFGGYALDGYGGKDKPRVGSPTGYQAIRHILETVGVSAWEKLPGQLIRVDDPGLGRSLERIGHIIEDRWFDLKEHMKGQKE